MLQGAVPLLPGLLPTGLTKSLLQSWRASLSGQTLDGGYGMHRPEQVRAKGLPGPFSPVDIFLTSLLLCPEASCHRCMLERGQLTLGL